MTWTTGPSTVADLFKMSLQGEEMGLRFYRRMSMEFAHAPEVAAVWTALMEDETLHLRSLHSLAARLQVKVLAQPISDVQARRARDILNILTDRRIERVENLDDAYRLAKEYESSEINRLFTFLMTKDLEFSNKQSVLRHELGEHQAKLDLIKRLVSGVEARKAIRPLTPTLPG